MTEIEALGAWLAEQVTSSDSAVVGPMPPELRSAVDFLEQQVWNDLGTAGPLWSSIRLIVEGRDEHPSVFMRGRIGDGLVVHSELDERRVTRALRDGATLVHDHLQEASHVVRRLQEFLEYRLRARMWVQAYLTRSDTTAFGGHVDDHNFFILQLHGSKQWALGVSPGRDREMARATTLTRGEFMLVPADTMHGVYGVGEPSLHLTLAFDWLDPARAWGSSLSDATLAEHLLQRRIGTTWPLSFAPGQDVSGASYRLASRVPPAPELRDGRVELTSGSRTFRLDGRAADVIYEWVAGRDLGFEQIAALAPALSRAQVEAFLQFAAREGLILRTAGNSPTFQTAASSER